MTRGDTNKMFSETVVILLNAVFVVYGSTCLNLTAESNCGAVKCEHWYQYENYNIVFLRDRGGMGAEQFNSNMNKATEIALTFGPVFPEPVRRDKSSF